MWLQVIPHRFSCMHTWQIWNPQEQLQQKIPPAPQQTQRSGGVPSFFLDFSLPVLIFEPIIPNRPRIYPEYFPPCGD
jgi:hypothetical protein